MSSFLFDFELPADRIAQEPCEPRDHARLLVLHRSTGALDHRHFYDLPELLKPGDLLILNDTRVLPARLRGQRARTGGKWEGLFLGIGEGGLWQMLCQTRGQLHEGESIDVARGALTLKLTKKMPDSRWLAEPIPAVDPVATLEKLGEIPLPFYIRKGKAHTADREHYQTVYARQTGAVAAPTAGLHFTPELFNRLEERGIGRAFVTLHVGYGTFQPVQVEDFTRHQIHSEWGELPAETAQKINECQERGGRIFAIGTTSVRVLESAARGDSGGLRPPARQGGPPARQTLNAWSGWTDLFIYPPYPFHVVDALVTNFHLPRTTLLLLVAAFGGVENIQRAYDTALKEGYRFYSYGDAMLIA